MQTKTFVCNATITEVLPDQNWYYTTCPFASEQFTQVVTNGRAPQMVTMTYPSTCIVLSPPLKIAEALLLLQPCSTTQSKLC
ncbi:hypothetical protein HanXRQr2_Chr16g0733951 [Helianthus annuus]|uniref:Uncharacterized protein n=1 Tax=Helianthus annuus TaxID=4232 RepID=A0A251RXF1_HELAN|nr:hypothetical protein HanXRQr2_Chr16g0733951 [Helianthus annuus]KAJ0820117.1 hypothetical protein HanPSC8_Chr16g0704051 [Helianthus annuus]